MKLFNYRDRIPYVKDAFHEYLIHENKQAVNPALAGTKMAAHSAFRISPGESATIKLRLTDIDPLGTMDPDLPVLGSAAAPGDRSALPAVPRTSDFGAGFDAIFSQRMKEADEFYNSRISQHLSSDARMVMRQAYSGMLWSKQFYHYDVQTWLDGDPASLHGRACCFHPGGLALPGL